MSVTRSFKSRLWIVLVVAALGVFFVGVTSAAEGPPPATDVPAAEASGAPRTFFGYFQAGRLMMWPILACSVVALAFVIERSLNLRRKKVMDDAGYDTLMDMLKNEGVEKALAHAQERSSPMHRVLAAVLTCGDGPRAEMETVMEDAGARVLWDLNRNAKPLGVISNVSPLLGLLGTVLGIIRAFSDIAAEKSAMGDPGKLAVGIYEALITTAFGLCVAIPAFLFYHFFRDKADAMVREIEEKALGLIGAIVGTRPSGGRAAGGGVTGREQ